MVWVLWEEQEGLGVPRRVRCSYQGAHGGAEVWQGLAAKVGSGTGLGLAGERTALVSVGRAEQGCQILGRNLAREWG